MGKCTYRPWCCKIAFLKCLSGFKFCSKFQQSQGCASVLEAARSSCQQQTPSFNTPLLRVGVGFEHCSCSRRPLCLQLG